jgi:hypothetical protein
VEDRPPAIINVWGLVGKAKSFVCYAAGGGGGTAQAVRALQGCAAGMALGWRWPGMAAGWALLLGCWAAGCWLPCGAAITRTTATPPP